MDFCVLNWTGNPLQNSLLLRVGPTEKGGKTGKDIVACPEGLYIHLN